MMYPLVLDLAADGIPVAVTCRVLGFSKQAFYKWREDPVSQRDWDDAHLINAAIDIHHDDPEFGYRFITDELPAHGLTGQREPGRPAVLASSGSGRSFAQEARACTGSRARRCTTTWSCASSPPTAPNQLWLTDITEHPHRRRQALPLRDQGRLLQPDRRLLDRLPDEGAARRQALAIGDRAPRPARGDRAHSDRGSPISLPEVRPGADATTDCAGRWAGSVPAPTTPRWSRSSPCCRRTSWTGNAGPPASELRLAIVTWIERTYHRRRRQRRLGRLTPIEFETLNRTAHAA